MCSERKIAAAATKTDKTAKVIPARPTMRAALPPGFRQCPPFRKTARSKFHTGHRQMVKI